PLTKQESGGIVDDRYITDPAAVQGGETRVNTKDIPTELTAAHSKLTGVDFYMNHRYKVGHWHYERDSVTDTIVGRTYVPVTSFTWTMGFKMAKHRFINKSGLQDTTYFANTYLGLGGTDENTRYNGLRNTVGVSLLEGFNRYAKFGLSAFATHELRKYHQVTDSVSGGVLPEGLVALPVDVAPKHSSNLIWVGGQLTKQRGSVVTYGATAQFGVAGDVAGDIDIAGDVATRFQLFGDTVSLKAYGYFKNLEAPYLLKNYISNHYAWQNSFSKETRFRVGGELTLPFTGSQVNVGYETLKNYLYFGADATPQQHSSPVHVLSATLKQRVNVASFYWDTELTLQTTTNDEVLPLPKFAVYSNVCFKFLVASVLHVQLGVDGNYYTSYYAPGYNPATMTFHNQRDMKCGDFAFMNLYANFNLKQARFYVMYSHANKGLFGKDNYFSVPHYPLNPARFLLGVSVRFVN
ncbi:MAG: putative porin, partial [Muribaculaceae bacterium]|nr:putative porin [Muribaculaceae bacterium]